MLVYSYLKYSVASWYNLFHAVNYLVCVPSTHNILFPHTVTLNELAPLAFLWCSIIPVQKKHGTPHRSSLYCGVETFELSLPECWPPYPRSFNCCCWAATSKLLAMIGHLMKEHIWCVNHKWTFWVSPPLKQIALTNEPFPALQPLKKFVVTYEPFPACQPFAKSCTRQWNLFSRVVSTFA